MVSLRRQAAPGLLELLPAAVARTARRPRRAEGRGHARRRGGRGRVRVAGRAGRRATRARAWSGWPVPDAIPSRSSRPRAAAAARTWPAPRAGRVQRAGVRPADVRADGDRVPDDAPGLRVRARHHRAAAAQVTAARPATARTWSRRATFLASQDVIGIERAADMMAALLGAPVSTGFVSRCLVRLDDGADRRRVRGRSQGRPARGGRARHRRDPGPADRRRAPRRARTRLRQPARVHRADPARLHLAAVARTWSGTARPATAPRLDHRLRDPRRLPRGPGPRRLRRLRQLRRRAGRGPAVPGAPVAYLDDAYAIDPAIPGLDPAGRRALRDGDRRRQGRPATAAPASLDPDRLAGLRHELRPGRRRRDLGQPVPAAGTRATTPDSSWRNGCSAKPTRSGCSPPASTSRPRTTDRSTPSAATRSPRRSPAAGAPWPPCNATAASAPTWSAPATTAADPSTPSATPSPATPGCHLPQPGRPPRRLISHRNTRDWLLTPVTRKVLGGRTRSRAPTARPVAQGWWHLTGYRSRTTSVDRRRGREQLLLHSAGLRRAGSVCGVRAAEGPLARFVVAMLHERAGAERAVRKKLGVTPRGARRDPTGAVPITFPVSYAGRVPVLTTSPDIASTPGPPESTPEPGQQHFGCRSLGDARAATP